MNINEDIRYIQSHINLDCACDSFKDLFDKVIQALDNNFYYNKVDTSVFALNNVKISIGHSRYDFTSFRFEDPTYSFRPYIHITGLVDGKKTEVYLVSYDYGLSAYSRVFGEETNIDKKDYNTQINPEGLALIERASKYFRSERFTPEYENSKDNEIKNVLFKDGELEADVIYEIYELINRIPIKSLTRLAVYEKICRFLEYGRESADIQTRCWSDVFLRQEFEKNNLNFNEIITKKLKNINDRIYATHSRDSGSSSIELSKIKDTVLERVKQLGKSFDTNNFEIECPYNVFRIFDTYARITNMEFEGIRFNVKYIYVPDYFEIVFFNTKDIPMNFFNTFEYKKIKMKDSPIIEVDGEQYGIMFIPNKKEELEYGLVQKNGW